MDATDYIHLDNHIKYSHTPSGATMLSRSPICAFHHNSMQPGWDTVLVMWDASPRHEDNPEGKLAIKVAVFSYTPTGDMHYRRPSTENEHDRRSGRNPLGFDIDESFGECKTFDTMARALKEFTTRVGYEAEACEY